MALTLGLILSSFSVMADPVTSTFNTGDSLTASSLNEVKASINDNDTRITTLESTPSSDTLANLSCTSGQVVKFIGSAWVCAEDIDTDSGGDVTGVIAGTGLTGGGASGDVTIDIDTAAVQARLQSACASGSYIRDIAVNGTPTCENVTDIVTDTTYTAGSGLSLTDTTFSVDPALTVNSISYSTPRTHYISVPAEAFVSASGNPVSTSWGQGGAYSLSGTSDAMVAPIFLPDGAIITEFTLYYLDNDATYDMTAALQGRGHTSTSFIRFSNIDTSGTTSSSIQTISNTLSLAVAVDNSTSNYSIRVFANPWPSTGTLKINSARIAYTISEVE